MCKTARSEHPGTINEQNDLFGLGIIINVSALYELRNFRNPQALHRSKKKVVHKRTAQGAKSYQFTFPGKKKTKMEQAQIFVAEDATYTSEFARRCYNGDIPNTRSHTDPEGRKQKWTAAAGAAVVAQIERKKLSLHRLCTTWEYPEWMPGHRQGRPVNLCAQTHRHTSYAIPPHEQILHYTYSMWPDVAKAAARIQISAVAVDSTVRVTVRFLQV